MEIQRIVNHSFLTQSRIYRVVVPLGAISSVLIALYYTFMVVPNEKIMGAVQRIFYFHVGSALAAYMMVGIMLCGSVLYLALKDREWDFIAQASASVATVLCTIVLVSGMIWGHSAWNTWWRWEPRLVSFLVLWLMLVSYVLLRDLLHDEDRVRSYAAVLGIVVSVNVPIVMFSIKLLSHTEQLHPEVVANQGLGDSRFVIALILGIVAVIVFSFWLFLVKLVSIMLHEDLITARRG